MTTFDELPAQAAWRHLGALDGFEVLFATPGRLRGHTSAFEEGNAYAVRYDIRFDERWHTRSAHVAGDTPAGPRETLLEADGEGSWTVDGAPAPQLDGLIDVDLEASACTNAFPIHRLAPAPGRLTQAPAAYVRALDLSVVRIEQTYLRRDDRRFDYTSPGFDFEAILEYDAAGLIVDYPGVAVRFA